MLEQVTWVDKLRKPVRIGPRKEIKELGKEYKQSVNLWIINLQGEFLLQKRASNKKHNPNKWANTGGGIQYDETSIEAVVRECKEELGINIIEENLEYKMMIQREFDYVDIYVLYQDIDLNNLEIDYEEVSEVKYFSTSEIEQMIDNDELALSSRTYFGMLQIVLKQAFDNFYVKQVEKKVFNSN